MIINKPNLVNNVRSKNHGYQTTPVCKTFPTITLVLGQLVSPNVPVVSMCCEDNHGYKHFLICLGFLLPHFLKLNF